MSESASMTIAFMTGSHVYGTPHKKSDVDLVIRVDESTRLKLLDLFGKPEDKAVYGDDTHSIKIGDLNLIMVTSELDLHVWRDVTKSLKKHAPVTREVACLAFKLGRELASESKDDELDLVAEIIEASK